MLDNRGELTGETESGLQMKNTPSSLSPGVADPNSAAAQLAELRSSQAKIVGYVRNKVDQLLNIIGTLPLKPEELDDDSLISLDPIGIVAESFEQVLDHLKETNEDLLLARDQVQAIFDSAGAAIIVVDTELRVLACNALSRTFFFDHQTEVFGRSLQSLGETALVPAEGGFFDRIITTGSKVEHSDFVYRERHYHLIGTPIKGQDECVSKVVLLYTDTTDRKKVEQSLRDTESRLQTILDSIQAGILLIDAESHCIADVNESAMKLIGAPRERIIGSMCHGFVCPNEQGHCPMTSCSSKRSDNSERVLINAKGEKVPILKTVTDVVLGGRRYLLESFIDISLRKQAQKASQESEEKYRSLYTTMKEGVGLHEIVYDGQGRAVDSIIVDVNPSYERMLATPRDEVLGRRGSEFYGVGDPPYLERFVRVTESGVPEIFETSFHGRYFHISVVSPSQGRFATIFDDITERKRAQDEIQRLAYSDTLTALPNRALLLDRLRESISLASRGEHLMAVLFLDLDRFKPINDTMGHSVGDMLLRAVAERLRTCVRSSDTVARVGGDEFVIILSSVRRDLDVTGVAREILERSAEPFVCGGKEIFTSLSIGIALYPDDGDSADTLLKNADMAMYEAKERGRHNYQFYSDEMNRRACQRLDMETSLRQALQRDEFFLCYQPQLNLFSGNITGLEALVRWQRPGQGTVLPDRFIPVCEETGLIVSLGEWVLRKACERNKAWQDAGLAKVSVAVNLSSLQFKQTNLVERVQSVLRDSGMDARYLELELTESMIMEDAEETVKTLSGLKERGVTLSIDDFGTGYSSLSYLKNFPIDKVKIAQEFVRDIPGDPGAAAIAETIIAVAKGLGLGVIAEGVETRDQLDFLRTRGCFDAQGYYFSRPIGERALTGHLSDWLRNDLVCPYRLT